MYKDEKEKHLLEIYMFKNFVSWKYKLNQAVHRHSNILHYIKARLRFFFFFVSADLYIVKSILYIYIYMFYRRTNAERSLC